MRGVVLYHNESDEQTANMVGKIREISPDLRICVYSSVMPGRAFKQRLEEISKGRLSVIDATQNVELNTLFKSLRLNPSS